MRTFLLLFVMFSILSCSNKSGNTTFLKADKMEAVLWDLMRVDELVNQKHQKDSTLDKYGESVALYKQVFQIHNISEEQFKSSLQHYQANPNYLKPILDSLQVRGNKMTSVFKPSTIE